MRDNKLFVAVKDARDTFKKTVNEAYAKRESELKRANKDHVGDYLIKTKNGIRADYDKAVRKAGKEFSSAIDPIIAEAEQKAKTRLQTIKPELISQIRMIEDMPFTSAELNILGEKFGNDYWCNQKLRAIALRNGIAKTDVNFQCEPDFATEMSVIEELKDECVEFIDSYDGSGELGHRFLLTNKKLLRWEEKATSGLLDESEMPDSMLVDRAFTRIATQPDELARGQQIGTELKNIRESARTELIAKIADSRILGETALRFSGFGDEIMQFREKHSSEKLQSAKKALQTVSDALNERGSFAGAFALDDALYNEKSNPYFVPEVQKAAKSDEKIKQAAEAVDMKRGSHLAGENKAD